MSYSKFKIQIQGDTLILHNGALADPLNPITKAMKKITANRKKVEADIVRLAELEYRGGLYLTDGKVVLPGMVLEAVVAEGAKVSKEGKVCLSSLYITHDAVLSYDGGPLTEDELVASEAHRIVAGVRVGQAKVMRTRPYFTNWSCEFVAELNILQANPDRLAQWVADAGTIKGIGDWRPRHGRYTVTSFKPVKTPEPELELA